VARKSQTPPPPRRPVQAPKQRATPAPDGGRNRWLVPGIAAAVGVLALAAVLGFVLFRDAGAAAALEDAGCTLETFPEQGRDHADELPEDFEYNSFPPTTGPHHPIAAPWGVYDEPVEQIRVIHNLEHGGVIVQYGEDVPEAEVEAILEWYRGDPLGKIVAPLPALGDEIALGAWVAPDALEAGREEAGEGVLGKCTAFDRDAFDAFRDTYGFRGPERFDRDMLQPGT
jgi:hypothetical protein